jgi:hypothetical protein
LSSQDISGRYLHEEAQQDVRADSFEFTHADFTDFTRTTGKSYGEIQIIWGFRNIEHGQGKEFTADSTYVRCWCIDTGGANVTQGIGVSI